MSANKDWRKTVGFPINYESSDDETDTNDVVIRHPVTSSKYLLEDRGDGAEADILGSTPPREQRRGKRGKKSYMDTMSNRRSVDGSPITQQSPSLGSDYIKKHMERKWSRLRERDRKTDLGTGDHRAESLPGNVPAVPTLVESCNRFMCLTSRLKKADTSPDDAAAEEPQPRGSQARDQDRDRDRVTASRVDFHKTFSMLINMGNVDKGCRRTISREEQVWQNELKDLIWLELQAKIAGRSLARQDAFLCAQRRVAPIVLANITNYRFVNTNPCTYRSKRRSRKGPADDLTGEQKTEDSGNETDTDDEALLGCLSLSCVQCSDAVGKALREVGTLLDSYHNALALYPSSNAMTQEHPLVATSLFNNRIKAMCLWYNSAVYMRLKMLAVRRMLRTSTAHLKQRRGLLHLASTDSDGSRHSPETRPCTVRFNVSNTPTDSNNSDSSVHSDLNPATRDLEDPKGPTEETKGLTEYPKTLTHDSKETTENPKDQSEEPKDMAHIEKEGKDDVDSGNGTEKRHSDTVAPPTPEIVIDSKYGTVESMTSQSSGYTSNTEFDVSGQEDDLYEMGSLEDLTNLRLLGKCDVSVYRDYHREMLKTQGVRRCMMFMNKLRKSVLGKVYLTLEKLDSVKRETSEELNEDDPVEVFHDTKEEEERTPNPEDDDSLGAFEMRRYGCWSEECLAMRLPSYRNHFLLLSSICMEGVHDYLTLRLEDRPQNPSCLTVKQLIHELKEGLDIATEMRAAFVRNIAVALAGHRAGTVARQELLMLINTYDDTVETVLNQYLSYLRKISEVEHMSRWSLQAEWTFTARLAKRVKCVALQAPVAFSEIACNQLNRSVNRFKEKFSEFSEKQSSLEDTTDRYTIYMLCREMQQIYACEREAALQAAVWARALAGRLLRAPQPYCKQRADIINSLMALRDVIAAQMTYIVAQSDVPPEDITKDFDAVMCRVRELLLQVYRLGFEVHKELHRFINSSRPQLASQRRSIQSSPPKCRVKLMRSESVGEDGDSNALDDKLFEGTAEGQTHSSIERILSGDLPLIEEVELRSSNAAAAAAGATDPAPTCDEEHWAKRVARAIVEFARCWMTFVLKRCDTGRGRRPRWASQGLEFLMLACDPCNTKYLTDQEFEELKKEMDGCISHVIGTRPVALRAPESGQSTPVPGRRRPIHTSISSNTIPYLANSTSVNAGEPVTGAAAESTVGNEDGVPTPPTPPVEPDPLLSFHTQTHLAYSRRVLDAIKEVDNRRDAALREKQALGRVVESAAASTAGPKLRHVQFKWQRGLKIGAGTFGKVYTVVTESGQLLAMKELSIGAGDRRALQRAANELRVLEGVIHPHLVRYYGCEVHREEMLIFMELCVEGSLEALIATAGALAEGTIRRYTKQLVSAVQEMHHRSIVHRDIKSGNIFLTNEGHCLKLGDFGCAVKIRANTTAAGELQGCVGTQAYMAPEVFMKSSGHGRAADIWSLGCVVTEMASGKRPWPQYDSNYQIMFVVGMGGRPEIPATLSEEGRDFCLRCLTHEPEKRARIAELAVHHFLMVKSDEDCNCQPAYLIT